jgi:GNAT superfamily N-acetyltransferase
MTELTYRPATDADLDACGRIWRLAINEYLPGVGQPPMPEDLSGIRRLHAHLLSTDPNLFWVAERDGRIVGFTAATARSDVWFLSMLFVMPDEQRTGVGSALLARTMPPSGDGRAIAVGSDSAYPHSNGLYARLGMPARMPVWLATGRPRPGWRPPALPAGITAAPIAGDAEGRVEAALQAELDALDRVTLGLVRPQDHQFLRRGGSRGWAYRDGDGGLAGYAYVAASGRIAPAAVREAALLGPVIGHLLIAYEPPGASAAWLPGGSDGAIEVLLDAGLRFEGFPILFGWSRAFADFSRCLPISPGLL